MESTINRQPLPLPGGHDKVLMHSCCAPCSGEVRLGVLYYGPDEAGTQSEG